jgi:outer membrane lipopolysaccharide assembly protein LptE/RlpB
MPKQEKDQVQDPEKDDVAKIFQQMASDPFNILGKEAAVLIAPMSRDKRVAFIKQIHLITRETARKIKEAAGAKK